MIALHVALWLSMYAKDHVIYNFVAMSKKDKHTYLNIRKNDNFKSTRIINQKNRSNNIFIGHI